MRMPVIFTAELPADRSRWEILSRKIKISYLPAEKLPLPCHLYICWLQ